MQTDPKHKKWNNASVHQWLKEQFALKDADVLDVSAISSQQLTHQQIKGQFIKLKLKKIPKPLAHYQWQPIKKLSVLAFPKFINQYLSQETE